MVQDPKTILVVEDNLVAAKVAKALFEKFGYQVEHVEAGEQAIKRIQEAHYNGIYMDIGLPSISGTQSCIAIRAYEVKNHLPPTPIIAVTGNNSEEERRVYLEAGMQEVIDKPLTQEKAEYFLSLL